MEDNNDDVDNTDGNGNDFNNIDENGDEDHLQETVGQIQPEPPGPEGEAPLQQPDGISFTLGFIIVTMRCHHHY